VSLGSSGLGEVVGETIRKQEKQRDHRPKAAKPDFPAQRVPVWLPAVVLLALLLVGVAAGVWLMNRPETGAAIAPAASTPVLSALSAEARQRLAGRWLRPDGGYVLTIKSVGEDGKVEAAYNNPGPINVSKAQAMDKDGQTVLHVELRDRNYPGNYYTLTYDPARDQLAGMYYHLGLGQMFDVIFERMR
jgi:hypothetical protein